MHLLYPSFLWALAALAIPIIVHLFNFRKAKLVRFSNVLFLQAIKKKSASTRNLKHLLILATRLFFLFFLVITFAQPFIPGAEKGLNSSQVDLFIDNSSSMSNLTQEGVTGLTAAIQMTEKILDLYPDNVKFRLITNDFSPSSNNYRSKENTLNSLLELDYSSVVRDGDAIYDRILRMEPKGNDIFILSDFQKSTVGQANPLTDSTNQFHFIPIGFSDFRNLLVDSTYLQSPFAIEGQRNQLIARIQNATDQPSQDVNVKLHLNGRQSASVSVNIDAKSTQDVTFELDKDLQNINRGTVSIEDYPITFDNEYFFAFDLVKNIKIVEVTESSENTAIGKVFSSNDLFNYKKYQKGNISYREVKNTDLLIINALQNIENGLKSQIADLLKNGKAVVVIPADNSDANDLSQVLGFTLTKTENTEKVLLEAPDANHPFFENIFEETSLSSIQPSVKLAWQWRAPQRQLLQSKTGMTFLSEISSRGKLYVFASSLDLESTDFTRNALFVPVMQRIAEKSSAVNQQLAYTLNRSIVPLQLDSLLPNELYKLKNGQDEIVPSQKANGNTLILDLPMYLMTPGFYDLTVGKSAITALALNQARVESDLAVMSMPEIEAQISSLSNKEIHKATEPNYFSQSMKDKYHRLELWKYALILSLVFLVAETLLIRYL